LGIFLLILVLGKFRKEKKVTFLLCWFFTPLVLTWIISQFFQPIFFDRYLLASIPAISLLVASRRKRGLTILIFAILLLLSYHNWWYFTHPSKRPFKSLASFVKEKQIEIPIINYNAAAHHLWESKYYGLRAPIYAPTPLPFYTGTALMEKEDVIDKLPDSQQILAITSAWPDQVKIEGYRVSQSQSFNNQLWLVWLEK